eukprot:1245966-Pyramimonas_sp.AAC.1
MGEAGASQNISKGEHVAYLRGDGARIAARITHERVTQIAGRTMHRARYLRGLAHPWAIQFQHDLEALKEVQVSSTRKQYHKDGRFRCTETLEDGSSRNTTLATQHMLTKRIVNAIGGSHGQLHAGRRRTTTKHVRALRQRVPERGGCEETHIGQFETTVLSL